MLEFVLGMPIQKPFKKQKKITRKRVIIFALIVLVILTFAVLYFKVIRKPQVTTTPSTTAEEDAQAVKEGNSAKNANSVQSNPNDKQANTASPSNQGVITPTGNFVSNHTIRSANDSIESICSTNVGATCEITFKLGDVTKSVGAKQTNGDGTAMWLWTPASIGLSSGTWEIIAISSYNGSTVSQADPRKLDVSL